jgi:hypothetical protein
MHGEKVKKLKEKYRIHKEALFQLSGEVLELEHKIKELEQIIDLDT